MEINGEIIYVTDIILENIFSLSDYQRDSQESISTKLNDIKELFQVFHNILFLFAVFTYRKLQRLLFDYRLKKNFGRTFHTKMHLLPTTCYV